MSPVFLSESAAEAPRGWSTEERRELLTALARIQAQSPPHAADSFRLEPVTRSSEALIRTRGPKCVEVHDLLLREDGAARQAGGPDPGPLAFLPKGQLRELGVPSDLIAAVRAARAPGDLPALGLPEVVRARLVPRLAAASPQPIAAVPAFLKYRADSVEVLDRYFRGDLGSLLLNLTDEQSQIVKLDARGPVLVNGVAGSGKTTVALYRLKRMVEERPSLFRQRLLYISYNRSLAGAARQLLTAMGVPMDDVEVSTLHRWCIHRLGHRRTVLSDPRRRELLQAVLQRGRRSGEKSAVLGAGLDFWEAEIRDVIKGRGLSNLDEYLSVERVGRGTGLPEAARRAVWRVFEAYEAAKGEELDWDDVVLAALRTVERSKAEPTYDHVYLDEAQDLPPVAVQLAQLLAGGPNGSLFITADPSQSIYRRGFRWKDVGVRVVGRSYSLTRNYRGTREILAAARVIWEGLETDEEDELRPEPSPRSGGRPRILYAGSADEQIRWVADEIQHLLAEGLAAPENIAVLARWRPLLQRLERALRTRGVPSALYRDELRLDDPKVKLITIHSSKGLEFPLAYVIGADDQDFISSRLALSAEGRAAALELERKLLYVGMTRAMQDLTLTASSPRGSRLLLGPLTERDLVEIISAPPVPGRHRP